MIKMLCAFLIIIGCGYIGIVFSSRYDVRIRQLNDFFSALKIMEFEISMNNIILSDALANSASVRNGAVSDFMKDVSDKLKNSVGLSQNEIWCETLQKFKKRLCLNPSDYALIKEFGLSMGKGNVAEETANIGVTREKLKIAIDEATKNKTKNSKLYRSLGFICGILISVLLL